MLVRASRRRCLAHDRKIGRVVTVLQGKSVTAHEISNSNMNNGKAANIGHKVVAKHGVPKLQGYLFKLNGEPVLGYMKEGEMLSYTTIGELLRDVYTRELPEYKGI